MIIILEILTIISYLFSDILGFCVSFIMFASIWGSKKYDILNKIIISLILSVPIFQISFLGDRIHHLFSWFMIYLVVLIMYLFNNFIREKIRFSKLPLLLVSISLAIIIINNILSDYYKENLVEFIQILLMVIPILIVYQQKKYLVNKINDDTKQLWIKFINVSIVATAIATIIQYFLHTKMGIIVGNVSIHNARTIYDLLFKGSSVLSIYLGIGIVLNMNEFLDVHKIKNILIIFISMLGIMVNSSRTGLVVAAIVCILILAIKSRKSIKNFSIATVTLMFGIIIFYFAAQYILQNRAIDGFLGDNGRFETYIHGLKTIGENVRNFLFGIGLSSLNYDFTLPHNFVLQTMLTMGIIVTVIWIILICYILKYVNKIDFRYILWHIFISSMFVTSFQDMSFITLYIILAILLTPIKVE